MQCRDVPKYGRELVSRRRWDTLATYVCWWHGIGECGGDPSKSEAAGAQEQRARVRHSDASAYLHRMLDWSECPVVERVPGKVSGIWLFKGTRVPVKALFENLESGARVDDFLEWFPGVTREQVEAVLEHAEHSLAVA